VKKILYIVDTYLTQYHSVRDILIRFLKDRRIAQHNQVIAHINGYSFLKIEKSNQEGFVYYTAHHKKLRRLLKGKNFFKNFFLLIKQIYYYILKKLGLNSNNELANRNYLKKIIKKEKPDIIFFYTFSPRADLAKMCKKLKLPYIQVLYDTYITRPDVNFEIGLKNEMYVMDNSIGYFVPKHVYKEYLSIYKNKRFTWYEYPLIIDKELVENTYMCNKDRLYDFTYLGQIQTFRNGNRVKEILKQLDLTLHIFCIDNYQNQEGFVYHPGVTGQELYNVIVQSKFLVVFDNSVPYNNMLPSKAYSYVSFTKPIIVFGDNTESALISFLQEYPCYYYHHFGDSLDGLIEFIKNNTQESAFNLEIYSKYSFATKEVAIAPIYDSIKNVYNRILIKSQKMYFV